MWRLIVAGGVAALALHVAPAVGTARATPPTTDPLAQVEGGDGGESGTVTGADAESTPVTLPLIPVPTGCASAPLPHIVFIGTVDDRDYRTVRFEIEQIRGGRPEPFAADGRIDVRYGLDAQYLDDDGTYLVSAMVDPDLGLLVSKVTEPIEHFGGDEVIGVSETDVDCPVFENPMRTLHPDGTAIEGGVLDPFVDARVRILGAIVMPLAVAFGVVFVLAMFRVSMSGLYSSVVDGGRPST